MRCRASLLCLWPSPRLCSASLPAHGVSYTVTMQHHTLLPVVPIVCVMPQASLSLLNTRFTVVTLGVESVTVRYVMPRLVVRPVT